MLAGVMRPDHGRITIDDVDVVADPEAAKQHISYMPQRFGLYEDLTVEENIRFYADLFEVPRAPARRTRRRLLAASGHETIPLAPCRAALRRHEAEARSHLRARSYAARFSCSTSRRPASIRSRAAISGAFSTACASEGVTIVISTAYLDEAERCNRLALLA